jgi:hypothetical protein
MLVMVPFGDSGAVALMSSLEDAVASGKLDEILKDMKRISVNVTIPRFKMTWSENLKDTLASMGMKDTFTPGKANFSGITKHAGLSIDLVAHKAFVEVDEEGPEAAAAPVDIAKGDMQEPPAFRADRPFVFLIRENATGAILFMGRVVDPRATVNIQVQDNGAANTDKGAFAVPDKAAAKALALEYVKAKGLDWGDVWFVSEEKGKFWNVTFKKELKKAGPDGVDTYPCLQIDKASGRSIE